MCRYVTRDSRQADSNEYKCSKIRSRVVVFPTYLSDEALLNLRWRRNRSGHGALVVGAVGIAM